MTANTAGLAANLVDGAAVRIANPERILQKGGRKKEFLKHKPLSQRKKENKRLILF